MSLQSREVNGFECSDTDKSYLESLVNSLKKDLPKEDLVIEVANIVLEYERKPVNGLIRDVVSDIECHLGIYESRIRDFEPRNDIDYKTGVKYFIDLLNTLRTLENFILPASIYNTYIRWLYYNNEKIEVDVLYMDKWNYILYKDKHVFDFYISVVFNQSFASWDIDFKIEGEQKQRILSMINSGEISKPAMVEIVDYYKAEYYRNKK